MSSRIAVFFQKILHPPSSYGKTIFVDCEDTSKSCSTNSNCTNLSCGDNIIDFPENEEIEFGGAGIEMFDQQLAGYIHKKKNKQ